MKTITEKIDQITRKGSVLLVALAGAALFACNGGATEEAKEGITDADATSTQDTFQILTGEGAGHSIDTSAIPAEGVDTKGDSVSSTSLPRREFPRETDDKANDNL